jgi:iron complex outermembrane receptor protein
MQAHRPRARALWLGASALALAAMGVAGRALAAEAAESAESAKLDEVVVTAEKRSANLQKTPIAISVMSAGDLAQRHAQSLEDLSDGSIPSLRIAPFFVRNSALTVGMRGIGSQSDANQPARDQAVGVYIDGVYLGRAQGLGAALYDVERIEVLKGPQGTLFGRNTEGGAISIVTKRPSGEFAMRTVAGYGNFNSYKVETHIDLPAFADVAVKFDGLLSKRDGTIKNPTSSGQPDFNAYDKRGAHLEAEWKPAAGFSADYAFDVGYDGTTPSYIQLLVHGSLPLAPLMQVQPERASSANIGVPLRWSVGDTYGHRLTLDWQALRDLEVKVIGSYRKLHQSQYDNGEENLSVFAPNGNFSRYSLAHFYQHQYSAELQLIGKAPSLEYVAGAFYYNEFVRDNAQTPNSLQWNATGTAYSFLTVDLDHVSYDRASHVTTESSGVFAQAVWTPPVLDGIAHLTVGGRLTHDAKRGSLDTVNGALPSYVNAAKQTITGVIPLDRSWTRFDPLVNLAVDATQDVHLYARWSTGYKAGGANSRSLTYRPFDPESVKMWELGAKTEFWDRRARFNVAAYEGDLKDVQIDFSVIILNNNRGTLETTNAATGKTKGFEADIAVVPVTGLTLSASYAYTKITLSQAFNPFTNASATVFPLYAPKNAGAVAADYEHPLMGATFQAHIDVNFADGQYSSSTDPNLSDKSTIANARLAITDIALTGGGPRMQLALWSRNLFDEKHAYVRNFNAALGTYGVFNEPRTFGVEASVKY